ncbi:MAG: methyltransferase domain-containing protein [Chloroflexota bacterium]
MTKSDNARLASSTGDDFSNAAQLDGHFAACQPEYESMLRSVELQPGWTVLDAGCGVGSFLPLMGELVGPNGLIHAIDTAPENVATVEERKRIDKPVCPVEARVGDATTLPYDDNAFDAVWCANVTQYLTDAELTKMLGEFMRVLRPDGILALKEFSLMCWQYQPLDPFLMPRLWQALIDVGTEYTRQTARGVELPTRVRKADFEVLRANTVMFERWQPITDVERSFFEGVIGYMASLASTNELLSDADKQAWERLNDFDAPDHLLDHPDFYTSEGHMMVVAKAVKKVIEA